MQSVKTADLPENPREHCNFVSAACFWYVHNEVLIKLVDLMNKLLHIFRYTLPTFIKGRKKTLETEDLYKALKEHRSG